MSLCTQYRGRFLSGVFQAGIPEWVAIFSSKGSSPPRDWTQVSCLLRCQLDGLPLWASLMAQTVKNLPAMQETWVWSLGWGDPLEKGKATHSSTFDWRIPWTEARYSPRGHKELATAEQLTLVIVFFLLSLKTLNFWLCCVACGILVSQPEVEPNPSEWKDSVLTVGLPENTPNV